MLNTKKSLLMISLVLLIATVTALDVRKTEFVIGTDPYLNISVSVVDTDTNEEVELFEGRARKFGEFRFTYYGTIDKISLEVRAINNDTGEIAKEEKFGPYTLGTPTVNLNFSLGNQKTEEVVETTESSEETGSETNPVTGMAIGEEGQFRTAYYYVAAAILGLIIVVFVLRRKMSFMKSSSSPVEPNPSKIVKKSKPAKTEVVVPVVDKSNDSSISDTEKRISDLQKQLEQVRNEEKLAKLQKQLKLEQQSLKRMQDESDDRPQSPPNNNLDNQRELPKI